VSDTHRRSWLFQLRERGVIRVAASYAVIAWLLLQIADVTFEPLGLPRWAMPALIVTAALGFPVAVLLAWFLELGDHGITRDAAAPDSPRPRVHGLRRYADVTVIGVLLATVAVLLVKQSDLGRPPPPDKPSVAVLPFDNLSGDPEQQYFSDGLAEEVLDRLGQVPGLLVVSRSSSFSFRDRKLDVRTIAERLGVAAVLEGAVRRDEQRLKLNAKLVDGKTGYQLWSGSFDREVHDVFAVQAELAQAVIEAIVPLARGDDPAAISAAISATPPTTSLSAYDLYLLGRASQTQRGPMGSAGLQRSVGHFRQALKADPKFARAQAALANSLVLLIDLPEPGQPAGESLRRAEAAVYQALALDPNSSDAQVAYANLLRYTGRAGAEDAYKRALELNPNNSEGWHGYAVFLGNKAGRHDESAAAVRRALELDPRSAVTWANYLNSVGRPGSQAYRDAVDRAVVALADISDALQSFGFDAALNGYPEEAMKFLRAAEASGVSSAAAPEDSLLHRALALRNVDPDGVTRELEAALAADRKLLGQPFAFLLIDVIGVQGDEARLRELFAELGTVRGADDQQLNLRMAFWYSVFGDHDEAAGALAKAEPVPESPSIGGLGASIEFFQALPAMLRVYRATGRGSQADDLANRYLAKWRAAYAQDREATNWSLVDLAALAANEGHRDEAIDVLEQMMRLYHLPPGFRPVLPWFRGLEGEPRYDAIVRERAARIERSRSALLALEQASGMGAPAGP
jgi:TolB-like protein/tetratricopeptide (TPR) repeat protein